MFMYRPHHVSVPFAPWLCTLLRTHQYAECLEDWKELWVDDAFWHLLFALLLLAIMVLWRPTNNNQVRSSDIDNCCWFIIIFFNPHTINSINLAQLIVFIIIKIIMNSECSTHSTVLVEELRLEFISLFFTQARKCGANHNVYVLSFTSTEEAWCKPRRLCFVLYLHWGTLLQTFLFCPI